MKANAQHLLEKARSVQETIVCVRRNLHEKPEIGLELPETRAIVKNRLSELGFEYEELGDGIVVTIGDPSAGKTILLRGDMDGLPITEELDLSFKSNNENMHACGHDIHASALLGAAEILKDYAEDLPGCIKLMFQPAEETLSGAKKMIECGVLENPSVDAAMMIHVFTGFPVEAGTFLVTKHGAASMAPDEFHISIQGKGGHGAMPHTCVDPLNIAAHTHIALQEMVAREIKPSETALCVVGQMSGGIASNVVPDTAKLIGCIRTTHPETRAFMKQRLVEISEGTAQTFRGSAQVEYTLQAPSVMVCKELWERGNSYARELFGEEKMGHLADFMEGGMIGGSEDFGFVSEKVPAFMGIISMGDSRDGYQFFHHHPKTEFEESKMYMVAAYYAHFALRWLEEESVK